MTMHNVVIGGCQHEMTAIIQASIYRVTVASQGV